MIMNGGQTIRKFQKEVYMRRYLVVGMVVMVFLAVGCGSGSGGSGGGGGGQPGASPAPYTFSVSGARITIQTLGACGNAVSDTIGAVSYNEQITCNGEAHALAFSNIKYSCGSVISFDVTIDGTALSWSDSSPPTCEPPIVEPPVEEPPVEKPPVEEPPTPPEEPAHILSVSGTEITISDLGECGDYVSDTLGAVSYDEEVTCSDEPHTLLFSNIEYDGWEIASFDVTIDGVNYVYP